MVSSSSTRAINGIRMWPVAASGARSCALQSLEVDVPRAGSRMLAEGTVVPSDTRHYVVKVEALKHWSTGAGTVNTKGRKKKSEYARYNKHTTRDPLGSQRNIFELSDTADLRDTLSPTDRL